MMRPLSALCLAMMAAQGVADDTEIYYNEPPANGGVANVLFILDTSGSMAKAPDGSDLVGGASNEASRYSIMKRVLEGVISDMPAFLNAGVMNYGGHAIKGQANGIKLEVAQLKDAHKVALQTTIDAFTVGGYTPIVQSLYEAHQYFAGGKALYGDSSNSVQLAAKGAINPSASTTRIEEGTITGTCVQGGSCDDVDAAKGTISSACTEVAASGATTGTANGTECIGGFDESGCLGWNQVTVEIPARGAYTECPYTHPTSTTTVDYTYQSPVETSCAPNFIILLSDGEPDDGLKDETANDVQTLVKNLTDDACQDYGDGTCGPELTAYLASKDQADDLEGIQSVQTYTVGFANSAGGNDYLQALANVDNPDGGFYTANDEVRLRQVFSDIIGDIAGQTVSQVPPVFSNGDGGLVTGKYAFLPMFRPGFVPRWRGNLKRYRYGDAGLTDEKGQNVLDASGGIVDTAVSAWLANGEAADGADVTRGGAAGLLGVDRRLYTDNGTGLIALDGNLDAADDLTLDGENAGLKDEIIQFARGLESDGDAIVSRQSMGDVLHSRPVFVEYADRTVVYVGTNEGYLHGFDAESGVELFAYMPRALLPNLAAQYLNEAATPHPYGVDGPITVSQDDNGKTYLYFGLRRGGRSYYALDISNPAAPKLLWTIDGAEGEFAGLGQTWSKPIRATVELSLGVTKEALIFGGGYDPQHDGCDAVEMEVSCTSANAAFTARATDSLGKGIYIVDAMTGALLKHIQTAVMTNSMPANPRVLDLDGNGVADRIYAADVGGRIFRIDLIDSENTSFRSGYDVEDREWATRVWLFADLGDDGVNGNRRFFYEPDIALIRDGIARFLSISIGSGLQVHPLAKAGQDASNRLYVLRDYAVASSPDAYANARVPSEDFTAVTNASLSNATAAAATDAARGYYIDLDSPSGEKALARAVTLNGYVFFTTFTPADRPADLCSTVQHTAKVYVLDARLAYIRAKNGDDELVLKPYLTSEFATAGILPEVYFTIGSSLVDGTVTLLPMVGMGQTLESLGLDLRSVQTSFSGLEKVYWEEEY